MKTLRKIASASVVVFFLAGCATSGSKFAEMSSNIPGLPPDSGRIYIYRLVAPGMAVQPEVKLNEDVVGKAVPNGFFYVDRSPGNYQMVTSTEVERKLSLTLDKGQTRFVRLNISVGFFVGHVYPELVDNEVGQKEIQNCRYIGK